MIEMYYNDVSGTVNDGIREVLYLLQKDFICTQGTKSNSLH